MNNVIINIQSFSRHIITRLIKDICHVRKTFNLRIISLGYISFFFKIIS